MKIRIDDLKDKAVHLSAEEELEEYPNIAALHEDGEISVTSPLNIALDVIREYDHIRVSGRVGTSLRLTCSRCLGDFPLAIDSPFTIFYMKSEGTSQDEDVELGEEDLITATYDGDEIDFNGEISEQVLLAIPYKPLCREDCMGLCPHCGTDLNSTRCNCADESVNLQFSLLKKLKIHK